MNKHDFIEYILLIINVNNVISAGLTPSSSNLASFSFLSTTVSVTLDFSDDLAGFYYLNLPDSFSFINTIVSVFTNKSFNIGFILLR